MMKRYAVITDASAAIGLGHATRQLVLARHAMRHGIHVDVLSNSRQVASMCDSMGVNVHPFRDLSEVRLTLSRLKTSRLVIDVHESMFPVFSETCTGMTTSVLVVSEVDKAFRPYGNHLIRMGSEMEEWNVSKEVEGLHGAVKVHAGRSWLMFREEFFDPIWPPRQDQTVLIAHGGTDPHHLTLRSIEALQLTSQKWSIVVLATKAFRHLSQVQRTAAESKHDCSVLVDSPKVAEWMRRATVGIINGGNVRYELCATGTPFIAIAFQSQQFICTKQITGLGAGINLGHMSQVSNSEIASTVEALMSDRTELDRMRDVMRTLFDGKGCNRLLDLVSGEYKSG